MTTTRGLTLIEMVMVIAIMAILASIGLPSLVAARSRAGFNQGVAAVSDCWRQARSLAVSQRPTADGRYYGVRLLSNGAVDEAQVIYGDGSGQAEVVASRRLPASVRLALSQDELVWFAQYGSGTPIASTSVASGSGSTATPQAVGIPGRPWLPSIADEIGIRRAGGDPTPVRLVAIDPSGHVRQSKDG